MEEMKEPVMRRFLLFHVLDLEIWDLDLQGSFARNSLPKISLLPVTFSRPSRWEAAPRR
jgi:hypothetical protein